MRLRSCSRCPRASPSTSSCCARPGSSSREAALVNIGAIEIQPVIDGLLVSQLWSTKPIDDPGAVVAADEHPMFRPDGLLESTLGGFLVRTGERVVLVDAGAGQPFADGYA